MSEPDVPGPLARRDEEPVFDEAWQAQVVAIAAKLVEEGVIEARSWSDALGAELARARERGEPDDPATYYGCVLAALEILLDASGRVGAQTLAERTEAWRRAYRNTPHGEPVELAAADSDQRTA